MKTTCEEVITMPTMQEIDHADKRAQEYSSALYVLLEPIFEAARRGVEADKRESENAIIMSLSANQTEAMYRRAENAGAERDDLKAAAAGLSGDVSALGGRVAELEAALAEHKAARIAYANEFPLVDGQPDVGSIHQNIRQLKAALAEAVRREQDLTRELTSSKADADSMARVWQRELCSNGISYQGKSHWIDFMALATKRVVALAMENGVKCCGYPELCTNENCNTLLRQRVEMYRERKGEHDEQH